jgi:hypothetical protein
MNPAGQDLIGERISEAIDIDNTPPVVTVENQSQLRPEAVNVVFEAVDSASEIRRAEYSINGQDWQTVFSQDGISDSRRERYVVAVPAQVGEYTISLRAFDANGNVGSYRISVRR